jgi:hypothetical protein
MIKLDLRKSEVREIQLSQGKVALVDAEDYEELSKYSWCASLCGSMYYAVRRNENDKVVSMHREIWGDEIPDDKEIDHADRDGLNNQRYNLRLATKSQQQANTLPYPNCSSKFKGVVWFKPKEKWRSRIRYKGKDMHLGYFSTQQEAAVHYDMAALGLFGVFAYLNFPELKDEYISQLQEMGFDEKEEGTWRK